MAAATSPAPAAAPAAPAPAATAPPPRSTRRTLFVLTWCALAVALLASAGAAWLLLFRDRRAEPVAERQPLHVFRAGTIVVNVAETNGRRYLRTTLELGAAAPKAARRLEEQRAPIIDSAIDVLSSTPLEELLDPARRDALREHLRTRINEVVGGDPISQVFFTEFVVQ